MALDPETLRQTMRLWATGVTVVAARHGELMRGMTVSSFTSVALEPPLILICIQKNTEATEAILKSQCFSVSILADGQEDVSNLFAGYGPVLLEEANRFDHLKLIYAETGSPILADAMGWLDCRIQAILDGSTHHIVVGEVVQASGEPETMQTPLLYFNRDYHRLE